jgi:hypothetical protein
MKPELITSVSQYLSLTEKIEGEIGKEKYKTPVLYRGETCYNKSIYASLFRDDIEAKKGSIESKFKNIDEESLLYQEAERMFPSIFNDCKDALDKMVKMQHYGLPTRLLDVTENPLVALYFACADYKTSENDGRILCEKKLNYADSNEFETVRMFAELSEKHIMSDFSLFELDLVLHIKNTREDRISAYKHLKNNLPEPFLIKPPILNERLRAQQGAFLFSPFAQPSIYNKKTYFNDVKQDADTYLKILMNFHFKKTAKSFDRLLKEICVIPAEYKELIINRLDNLGINMATMFPDSEHQMRYVYDKYLRGKKTDRWHVAKIDNL